MIIALDQNSKRKLFEEDEEEKKWAHFNCLIKLYGKRPDVDPLDKCYVLEEDVLATGK